MYNTDDLKAGCLVALLMLPILILLSFLTAGLATWLWGLIVVPVFGAPVISYWQMFGLIWLLRLVWPNHVSPGSND